ncbi:hypothetical protein SAMN05443247_10636 [Bradyrhizobium erythrophlei]|jgi:hypothetical protein|nr:hypothetical protein SAMN05443247_10636 [Bradyrhizobium erythrophlei]
MGGLVFVFPNSWEAIAMSALAVHRRAQADRLMPTKLWRHTSVK